MDREERLTPIVCAGTACESTMGDVAVDVCTYLFVTPAALALVGLVVGFSDPRTTIAFWLVVAGLAAFAGQRYLRWRQRVVAMRQGVARLLEAPRDALTPGASAGAGAPAAAAHLPTPVQFRATALFARAASGEEAACAICLEALAPADVAVELPCAHCFHRPCMSAWATASAATGSHPPSCPVCRGIVGPSNSFNG